MNQRETEQMILDSTRSLLMEYQDDITIGATFRIEKILKDLRKSKSTSEKIYPTLNFCIYLYGSILESEVHQKDPIKKSLEPCISDALEEFEFKDEYWDLVKNTTVSQRTLKSVVDHFQDHPEQLSLIASKVVTKSDLYDANTLNQQVRKLVKYKKTKDRIEQLESVTEELLEDNSETKRRIQELEQEVAALSLKVDLGISNKDIVLKLFLKGMSSKQIRDATRIPLRSVQRYIKELGLK